MAGIYIHIPFCRKACTYCDFHFSTNLSYRKEMFNAMVQEIELKKDQWNSLVFESIYFGGGTPSVLNQNECMLILDKLQKSFSLVSSPEITLEANPDDITLKAVEGWKQIGINRLSIGIQGLTDKELAFMNRSHTANHSLAAVDICINSGIDNVNVDLIYGSHLKSDKQWKHELKWAFSCGANHLSAYALTVEDKTVLAHQVKKGITPNTDDAHQSNQFMILCELAQRQGWNFYEISNLSKPGHEAIHNSNYWKNKPYLGIGPAAHSYKNKTRYWNISNNHKYMEQIKKGKLPQSFEVLGNLDLVNEAILTQLRLSAGLHLEPIMELAPTWMENNAKTLEKMKEKGWLSYNSKSIVLSNTGRLMADQISAELFIS